jgi:hypothetical protein
MAAPGRRSRWHVLLATPLLALVACTSGSAGTAAPGDTTGSTLTPTTQPSTDDSSDTTWNGLQAPLGHAATFNSGLTVTVAAPVRVKPSASMVGADPKQVNLSVAVTVTNGAGVPFDVIHLSAIATTGDAADECGKIRDAKSGLGAQLPATLAPGKRTTFRIGYSCPGQAGQALVVEVTPEAGFSGAQFTGSLP